ncbi:MAG: hypothetical protein Q4C70_02315 [Planctomycetia bacterium]|nr:hypothetical protein [Planctomycetia bacterium]
MILCFLLIPIVYAMIMGAFLLEESRSVLVILGVLVGQFVVLFLFGCIIGLQDAYWQTQVPKLTDEWVECRERGIPSDKTRAGKAIFRGRDGFSERGDLYEVLQQYDAQIADGSATPSELRGQIRDLVRQSNGVYEPLSMFFVLFELFVSTYFLIMAGIIGKLR